MPWCHAVVYFEVKMSRCEDSFQHHHPQNMSFVPKLIAYHLHSQNTHITHYLSLLAITSLRPLTMPDKYLLLSPNISSLHMFCKTASWCHAIIEGYKKRTSSKMITNASNIFFGP